ncbi:MAG: arginine--tRNA ligase [Candidatus Magasanikbacteria bacterium CG10_big_fil_rev_8_21_14_0_10_38_6]|uniref:Arginine--tRNA ligase n=1 Tax=Candidatus Magasanikbacteria bacterium CG10_big_fil_rev_8_21_14_0_10_38_6 TaxID=1974647 RepID=A0A2M6P0B5_9BACT|nr:MAG: arginine--tRNA ligase [Candidatus Magasanikbacteria bacterium CG10_big_fil_rev_8_21_14_0_10_38_6]
MNCIEQELTTILNNSGISGQLLFSIPPDKTLGDVALGCFALAKEQQKNPAEIANSIVNTLKEKSHASIKQVIATGPYVNITLNDAWLAEQALLKITKTFGTHDTGKGKKYLVEFACPNPMKSFHLGHLRNTITGESVSRILENSGYTVIRVNYQGDVGMHIAKSLWGIYQNLDNFHAQTAQDIKKRVEFLGAAYAAGSQAFETNEQAKAEILEYNQKVYDRDPTIQDVYTTARQWSLEYFDTIYQKLDTHFDKLYFESEVDVLGKQTVLEYLKKGIFKKSEGAIIFEGSKYGLHDRVFINSKGFPSYEGKEIGLAITHFTQQHPDKVIHVVGKEQTEYFKVVFKALEHVLPETTGKEQHLVGGYLQLKGDVKMSSRLGNVITGDALLEQVIAQVQDVMAESNIKDKEHIAMLIAIAALKYSMLKVGVSDDVAFDMNASVSISGDSGPYLLYITARIKSILRKAASLSVVPSHTSTTLHQTEKTVLIHLLSYPEITAKASEIINPAVIAKYLLDLAQAFNSFYHECPVLKAPEQEQQFRLQLIEKILLVMEQGLGLLGITPVEEM